MSANTMLLDFSIDPEKINGKELEKEIIGALEEKLGPGSLTPIVTRHQLIPSSIHSTDGRAVVNGESNPCVNTGTVSVMSGPRGSVVTIRVYTSTGLVTVNLDYYLCEGETPLLTLQNVTEIEARVFRTLGNDIIKRWKTFPAIRRGAKIDVYMTTSDERLLEYDVDGIVYDKHSKFQHIQILHSLNFGNILVLDDLQNLAESDLIYTHSIMCHGVENYTGKDILILGGGDGALLYELRKENPRMVTMIEIDEMVIQACRMHLRSACGDVLDNYKGNNYEIIIGDCVEYMSECISSGRKFDYVFGDLTDIPVGIQNEIWDFILQIMILSFKILNPNGKYMTHGNGSSSPGALKQYEDLLENLEVPVDFTRTHSFVPSFLEDWVFYQVKRKDDGQGQGQPNAQLNNHSAHNSV